MGEAAETTEIATFSGPRTVPTFSAIAQVGLEHLLPSLAKA
jgi:hypothetical protein